MCVIIKLPSKFDISFEKIKNATLNNPDGWGLVTVTGSKLEVERHCNTTSGNDPDEIYKRLVEVRDIDRYLHVRKNTVGKTVIENTHPFTVYKGVNRHVEFMHNGTLHKFRPPLNSDFSDTRFFSESFLSPLLYHFYGDNGVGDFTDPFFLKIIKDSFDYGSKGLLISNDIGTLELGSWVDVKDGDNTFRASNNDYFDRVQDTRLHSSRGVPAKTQSSTFHTPYGSNFYSTPLPQTTAQAKAPDAKIVTQLKDVKLEKISGRFLKPEDLESLFTVSAENFDNLDNDDIRAFAYLSSIEIYSWVKQNIQTASLVIELMSCRFNELLEEYEALDETRVRANEKHEKASKHVEDLTLQVADLKAQIEKLTNERDDLKSIVALNKKVKNVGKIEGKAA